MKYKVHLRDPEVFGTFDLTLGDLSLGLGLGIWTGGMLHANFYCLTVSIGKTCIGFCWTEINEAH